jgi:hypothetical protein
VRGFSICGGVGEVQVERGDGFGQVVRLGRAEDRGGRGRLCSTHASATWAMVMTWRSVCCGPGVAAAGQMAVTGNRVPGPVVAAGSVT